MNPHGPSTPTRPCRSARSAFTLVELLVVAGVITLLLGMIVPAITSVKSGQDVTATAYDLAGELETARNYAIANHTYTWVGFYEQDYNHSSAPASPSMPPYPGAGHVTVAVVYSKDGTKLDNANNTVLPAASLGAVGKIVHLYGVHLTALAAPGRANSNDPTMVNTLQGRPYQTDLDAASLAQTLINSDSADAAARPFVAQGYTFYKTIRYNPHGEASINGTLPCTRIIELGLQPTRGGVRNAASPNILAVQQTGIGGAVSIYRP